MSRGRVKVRLKQIQLENNRQDTVVELQKRISLLENEVKYYKYDHLTGLKTRKSLVLEFDDRNFPVYVILIDLNNLHQINRSLGYHEGDNFIKKQVNKFMKTIKKYSQKFEVYRIGGDEFFIILDDYSQVQEIINSFEKETDFIFSDDIINKETYDNVLKKLDYALISKKKFFNRRSSDNERK